MGMASAATQEERERKMTGWGDEGAGRREEGGGRRERGRRAGGSSRLPAADAELPSIDRARPRRSDTLVSGAISEPLGSETFHAMDGIRAAGQGIRAEFQA
jgi:hypothetical protein